MFHREVWAFLCLSIGLLIGGVYVGLPSRLVPLAADENYAQRDNASVSDAAIASLRRFAQTAAGLVARDPSTPVTTVEIATAAVTPSTTPAPTAESASQTATASTHSATQSASYSVPLTALKPADGDASWAMTRDIQAELARHGCYRGPMDGRWSTSVRSAVTTFNTRVNSTLPVDGPDFALLNLARSLASPVCMGQVATAAPAAAAPATAPVVAPITVDTPTQAAVANATPTTSPPAAEVTTVRLPAQTTAADPAAIATVPKPANTRMSLGLVAPAGTVAAAPPVAPPVTTAVVGAAEAPATPGNRDIHLFLHPLGQQ